MIEDSCYSVPAEAVTIAILNCASFQFMLRYEHKKLYLWNKECFYQHNKMFSGINSYSYRNSAQCQKL